MNKINFLFVVFQFTFFYMQAQNNPFPYELKPSAEFQLDDKLKEISGLSYLGNGEIAAVNDEQGIIFFLDTNNGKIIKETPFKNKGDFEGITVVFDDIYAIKSNGKIYKIPNYKIGTEEDISYKMALSSENDIEGLAFDAENNRLLIACKDKAGIEKKISQSKAIYAFDLESMELAPDPVWVITDEQLTKWREENSSFLKRVWSYFFDKNYTKFNPSGIAQNPINGYWYILAHSGKKIVVIDGNGKIRHIEEISEYLFPQPEGITFSADGTMYISNEGKEKAATLLKFNVK